MFSKMFLTALTLVSLIRATQNANAAGSNTTAQPQGNGASCSSQNNTPCIYPNINNLLQNGSQTCASGTNGSGIPPTTSIIPCQFSGGSNTQPLGYVVNPTPSKPTNKPGEDPNNPTAPGKENGGTPVKQVCELRYECTKMKDESKIPEITPENPTNPTSTDKSTTGTPEQNKKQEECVCDSLNNDLKTPNPSDNTNVQTGVTSPCACAASAVGVPMVITPGSNVTTGQGLTPCEINKPNSSSLLGLSEDAGSSDCVAGAEIKKIMESADSPFNLSSCSAKSSIICNTKTGVVDGIELPVSNGVTYAKSSCDIPVKVAESASNLGNK